MTQLKNIGVAKQDKKYSVAKVSGGENTTDTTVNLASKYLKALLRKKTDIAPATSSNSLSPVIDEVKYPCF